MKLCQNAVLWGRLPRCLYAPPLNQKSQSGAEFFSYLISIQFEAGLYLLAVATVTHIFLFNLFPFRIYKRFFPYGHNAKTDQRKQYCALAGLMFLLWKFLCFIIYHVTRFDEIFSYIKWWHADMFHCFCYLNCDIILVDLAGEICIKWNRTWIINSASFFSFNVSLVGDRCCSSGWRIWQRLMNEGGEAPLFHFATFFCHCWCSFNTSVMNMMAGEF